MEHKAFTQKADGRVNEIRSVAGVFIVASAQDGIPTEIEQFQAVWDTGATNTVVTSTVIERIGSRPITYVPVGTAGGEVKNAPVHLLNIVLPNNVIIPNIQVTELKDLNSCDILVGMDIISSGDFAITHPSGRAVFSFRMPSSRPIDFVPESNLHNLKLARGPRRASTKKKKKK